MQGNAIDVNNLSVSYTIQDNVSIGQMLKGRAKSEKKCIHALNDITFSVKKGSILGVVGKNGSGKSTLLRTIGRVFGADEGSIDLHGNKVSLLSLGVGFNQRLTGRENILLSGLLLGYTKEEISERMPSIIDFSEVGTFIDYPVSAYSSGMYSKLAFSLSTELDTDIILIDEVLSVGDEHFAKKSYNRMKSLIEDENHTVVIVSHNLRTIEELCTDVLWLHEGHMRDIGPAAEVLEKYRSFMESGI